MSLADERELILADLAREREVDATGANSRRVLPRLASNLADRIKSKTTSVRALTSKIAQSTWHRMYYAGQPNMIAREPDYDVDAVLDAIRLMPAVRRAVDVDERDLISAARAKGATWAQIGDALGSPPSSARTVARNRYARLGGDPIRAVKQWPGETAPTLTPPTDRDITPPPEADG